MSEEIGSDLVNYFQVQDTKEREKLAKGMVNPNKSYDNVFSLLLRYFRNRLSENPTKELKIGLIERLEDAIINELNHSLVPICENLDYFNENKRLVREACFYSSLDPTRRAKYEAIRRAFDRI